MAVLTLGLNHTTAPLDVRSRFAFAPAQLQTALLGLRARLSAAAPEAAVLSTCNRTELYLAADHAVAQDLAPAAMQWLADQGGVRAGELHSYTYHAENQLAARHAFRVAAGLDSMVLGEPQILGQMKQAVREAGEAGTLGTTLHQLFQRSFAVAKEVRTSTDIGAHSVSMAAASVRLAAELFEDLREQRVLFVGAGEMIELVATHFAAREPRSITLANRTLERGEALAARFGGEALRLADLPQRVRCPSSAWVRWSAHSRQGATGRCSWSIWPCRATSSRKWRSSTTCTSTPWTICLRWFKPLAKNARPP
jgi:glutamyl-tRNA reductase